MNNVDGEWWTRDRGVGTGRDNHDNAINGSRGVAATLNLRRTAGGILPIAFRKAQTRERSEMQRLFSTTIASSVLKNFTWGLMLLMVCGPPTWAQTSGARGMMPNGKMLPQDHAPVCVVLSFYEFGLVFDRRESKQPQSTAEASQSTQPVTSEKIVNEARTFFNELFERPELQNSRFSLAPKCLHSFDITRTYLLYLSIGVRNEATCWPAHPQLSSKQCGHNVIVTRTYCDRVYCYEPFKIETLRDVPPNDPISAGAAMATFRAFLNTLIRIF